MAGNDAYGVLAQRHGQEKSERYLKILKMVMNPFQAELVAQLPAPVAEVALKLGVDEDRIKHEIDDLFTRGVIVVKNPHTRDGARFPKKAMQFHDAVLSDARNDAIYGTALKEVWKDFSLNEWYPQLALEHTQPEQPQSRVIPAYKAVKDVPGLSPYDDAREIVKTASAHAVVPCPCRREFDKKGIIIESCLQFGPSADYVVARGHGKRLSRDEALALLDQSEEDGELHTFINLRTTDFWTLCNCYTDSCVMYLPVMKHRAPLDKAIARSRFEAAANQDLCTGCQNCIERCQFDAIDMMRPDGSKKLKARVDPEKCWGCGQCVLDCESGALSMKLVRSLEHIPEKPPK